MKDKPQFVQPWEGTPYAFTNFRLAGRAINQLGAQGFFKLKRERIDTHCWYVSNEQGAYLEEGSVIFDDGRKIAFSGETPSPN